jgi:hypothetical protein
MRRRLSSIVFVFAGFVLNPLTSNAQQPQIPTLQVCNGSAVKGTGVVKIDRRVDAQHAGTIKIKIEVKCDSASADGYPLGGLSLDFDLTDAQKGMLTATVLEQLTSTGKHTPTAYMSGRCTMSGVRGCRFWIMIADNHKAPNTTQTRDVVSVLVFDATGHRAAYGSGPLIQGDIDIQDTPN